MAALARPWAEEGLLPSRPNVAACRRSPPMKPVVTLTVNPALDAACVADEVVPMRKVRTRDERYDAGGGGINVARMIHELGGEAVAFYLAGGITGQAMEGLIEHSGIAAVRVPVAGLTRVSHTVYETSTGHEFRFTPEGPEVTEPNGAIAWRCSRSWTATGSSPAAAWRAACRTISTPGSRAW